MISRRIMRIGVNGYRGANAAPTTNDYIDQNLPADNLNMAVDNQANEQMDLEFDLNADPMEAIHEPLDIATVNLEVQLSLNPSDAPIEDLSSMDSHSNFPEAGQGPSQSKTLDVAQAFHNSNVVVLGLPAFNLGSPKLDGANAVDDNPEIEQLLPGDLLQEIDQEHQGNLNLQVSFMRHHDFRMIDPVFEAFSMPLAPPKQPVYLYKLWGQVFLTFWRPKNLDIYFY
jgi:hypothetical protein